MNPSNEVIMAQDILAAVLQNNIKNWEQCREVMRAIDQLVCARLDDPEGARARYKKRETGRLPLNGR